MTAPVLVTGATGTVGRHLVDELLRRGAAVRALTRRPDAAALPAGVEVVGGDLTRPETLPAALDGVAAVHLITTDGEADLTTGAAIVAALETAGVRRVTVLGGWEETSVEAALRASSVGWTAVRPGEFMDNWLERADEIRRDGVVATHGTLRSAAVHAGDIAAVLAVVLTEDGHEGRSYPVSGPAPLSPVDVAATLAEVTGRPIRHVALTADQERERLRALGYTEEYVEFGVALADADESVASHVHPTVEEVTGRPARSFATWAAEHADAFR